MNLREILDLAPHGPDTFVGAGPRYPWGGLYGGHIVAQALRGEPLTVYDDGSRTRSFCFVSDLVDGIVALMESTHTDPMNLGNPKEMKVLEFAQAVLRLTATKSEIEFVSPTDERTKDDPQVRKPDISLARSVLGWEPRSHRLLDA